MSSSEGLIDDVEIAVENIGGIDRTSVKLTPGVTLLVGRNATNRTSLLHALMAAHGSDWTSVKADSDVGNVALTMGDTTYERELRQNNGTVTGSGNPLLGDTRVADLFAFLLEDNAARRAVERGDDLREIIMEPVDTDEIQSEIRALEEEKQRLDAELDEIEDLERRLPELEQERTRIEDQIEAKRDELESKRDDLEEADASVEEHQETKNELEAKLEGLRDTQSTLEDIRYDLDVNQETLEALREEKAELEAEYEDLPKAPVDDLDRIEERLDELHNRKQSITADLNQLQTIVQFNEELLDDSNLGLFAQLDKESSESRAGSLTDQLLEDNNTVRCWTCGSIVEETSITEMLDELREFRQRKVQDRREIDSEIDELRDEKRKLENQQQRRRRLEREIAEKEDEIERTESTIDDLKAREEELEAEVAEQKDTIEDLRREEQSELLDLHKEVNQLEFDLQQLEKELEEVDSEIEEIERQVAERDSIERQRTEVQAELEDLRDRVDRIQQEAVEQFNDHIETLIDELGFENIERIWIEQTQQETREGRRKVSKSTFDLHIVREMESGSVYEDTIDHLSESEREVIGLVFSLAGYLVHDVHESVPFMLLDSLEAIDADRIATLVDYFSDYAEYLVVALLPEDAAKLDDSYDRITEI